MMSIPCCVAVPYLLSMKCTFTWLLLKYSKAHVLWYIGALTHKCKYSEFDVYIILMFNGTLTMNLQTDVVN